MPRPVSLTIPQPCHESWATMTPAAQGRHCAACDKVVLDFTQKTDAEILALLRLAAAPCGRFRPDQLGRPLLAPAAPAPRWRTWLAAAATVLGLREIAAEESRGQQRQPVAEAFQSKEVHKVEALRRPQQQVASPDTGVVTLRGRVIDKSTGQGLPGVTVLLVGTTTGVATGNDGTFELVVSNNPAAQLSFSFVGYTAQVMPLQQATSYFTVALDTDVKGMLGGELVIVGAIAPRWYTPRGLWQVVSRPFRHF